MHVDAFFEYCLNKPHAYYMQVPTQHEPFSEEGRDGVLMEEDLALRALLPEWRPKRGRRKAEERDHDAHTPASTAKRPHLDTAVADFDDFDGHHSALFPQSAGPWSAHPNASGVHDSWAPFSAITPSTLTTAESNTPHPNTAHPGGHNFRWRVDARENTPSTPYPQCAVPLGNGHPAGHSLDEIQSAVTPSRSKSRPRRRHGPAVSSAWSSGGNVAAGKLRGRPPSNRSIRDGPYSTFPANPNSKQGTPSNIGGGTPATTPVVGKGELPRFTDQSPRQSPKGSNQQPPSQVRPSRLQLQVPQHPGGPVRLATPPTLLVNGGHGGSASIGSIRDERPSSADFFDHAEISEDMSEAMSWRTEEHLHGAIRVPTLDYHSIAKAFAASLKEGDLEGGGRLATEDANRLAEKVINQIRHKQVIPQHRSPTRMLEHYTTTLGLNQSLGLGTWPPSSEKHISLRMSRSGRYSGGWTQGGFTEIGPDSHATGQEPDQPGGVERYEIKWKVMYGDLVGSFHFKELGPEDHSFAPRSGIGETSTYNEGLPIDRKRSQGTDGSTDRDSGDSDWKRRCLELQRKLKEKEEDLQGLRRRVLEAVF